jgi:hypothetical protein
MKPIPDWSSEEMIVYLDTNAASSVFFPVINYRYGTNQQDLELLTRIKGVFANGVSSLKRDGGVPPVFLAATRWLHGLYPEDYAVARYVASSNSSQSQVAIASLTDQPLTATDVKTLSSDFSDLDPDRKLVVVTLLAASESPGARSFLSSLESSCFPARRIMEERRCNCKFGDGRVDGKHRIA